MVYGGEEGKTKKHQQDQQRKEREGVTAQHNIKRRATILYNTTRHSTTQYKEKSDDTL